MELFLKRLFKYIFFISTLLLFLIFTSNYIIKNKAYKNNETESNLLLIKNNICYKYLILGISHARNMSRNTHHLLFEKNFDGSMINLGQGDGLGGLENQYWYLSYFLDQGNKADTLIFILSPTLLYSNQIDLNSNAFYREPVKLDFINHIFKHGGTNKYNQLFHYAKSKLGHHWWTSKPLLAEANTRVLSSIDTNDIKAGFKIAYPQGLSDIVFKERTMVLRKIIDLAKKNGMVPKLIIPPALFGKWPGHDKILKFIRSEIPNIKLLDHSSAILEPKYYYDHHHLNSNGMEHYYNLSNTWQ
jgi:hypothetical protein